MDETTRALYFLDNRWLEYVRGFTRTLHPLRKHLDNPLLVGDRPWDARQLRLYGTVLFDNEAGLLRMWYNSYRPDRKPRTLLCYATSENGIHWERPELDVSPHEGRRSNILHTGVTDCHGPSVLLDPQDPDPDRRYKMVYLEYHPGARWRYGLAVAVSPDGLHWSGLGEKLGLNSDNGLCLVEDGERYAAYMRADWPPYTRRIGRTTSTDLGRWKRPVCVLEPDANDPPQTQFYGIALARFEPYWVGALQTYHTREDDLGQAKMHGNVYVELAWSLNGICWHRTRERQAWLPLGEEGSWDAGSVYAAPPIVVSDEVLVYYCGVSSEHGDPAGEGAIGLATIRRDRFLSLDAGDQEAELLTTPILAEGRELLANVDAGCGRLTVEVLNIDGRPIEGYGHDRCVPIVGDYLERPVAWEDRCDLSGAGDQPIRLRIRGRNCRLYALRFAESEHR